MKILKKDKIIIETLIAIPMLFISLGVAFSFTVLTGLYNEFGYKPLIIPFAVLTVMMLVIFPVSQFKYYQDKPKGKYIEFDGSIFIVGNVLAFGLWFIICASCTVLTIKLGSTLLTKWIVLLLGVILLASTIQLYMLVKAISYFKNLKSP